MFVFKWFRPNYKLVYSIIKSSKIRNIESCRRTRLKFALSIKTSIVVNFSFIVISCTRSLIRHAVIIWLFGKIFENFAFFILPFFMFLHVFYSYINSETIYIILKFLNFNLSIHIQIIYLLQKKSFRLGLFIYFSYFKT